jgi:glycosyltransferase involved in cell wall biosynthesis
MLKILHVVSIMNTGGIETWLMNVLRNIDRTKIQFDFVVHTSQKGYYDDEIEKLGGKLIRVPKFKIINFFSYKKVWKEILENSYYKILHTHIRSTASIYLKIAKYYGIATISHSHNVSNGKFPTSAIKDIFQRYIAIYSDIRLACSNSAGLWLFRKRPFKIMKNAININLYKLNNGVRNEYREKYNFENNIVIGHIGRFSYQKNHNFLLDIFATLYKQNNLFRLVLVGDGELKKDIEKKVKEKKISNSVIFTGIRSDIPELLQMFDIFVFPSHYEGLGIVLLEAQASGLQCFISDTMPDEVKITCLINTISLNESAEFWANVINQNINYKRYDTSQCIKDSGYDIKLVVNELEDLYESL